LSLGGAERDGHRHDADPGVDDVAAVATAVAGSQPPRRQRRRLSPAPRPRTRAADQLIAQEGDDEEREADGRQRSWAPHARRERADHPYYAGDDRQPEPIANRSPARGTPGQGGSHAHEEQQQQEEGRIYQV